MEGTVPPSTLGVFASVIDIAAVVSVVIFSVFKWHMHFASVKLKKVKVKFCHTRYRALDPELIPVYRQSARRWLEAIHPAVGCHYFPPGLPSRTVSPPIGRYQIILLGDRGTCVWAACPRLLPGRGPAEIQIKSNQIKSTLFQATWPIKVTN